MEKTLTRAGRPKNEGVPVARHPSHTGLLRKDLLQGRSMSSLFSGEDHHRVARKLKAQEISWSKLDTATLFLSATGHDTEPARLFPIETSLLSTWLVTIELDESI